MNGLLIENLSDAEPQTEKIKANCIQRAIRSRQEIKDDNCCSSAILTTTSSFFHSNQARVGASDTDNFRDLCAHLRDRRAVFATLQELQDVALVRLQFLHLWKKVAIVTRES